MNRLLNLLLILVCSLIIISSSTSEHILKHEDLALSSHKNKNVLNKLSKAEMVPDCLANFNDFVNFCSTLPEKKQGTCLDVATRQYEQCCNYGGTGCPPEGIERPNIPIN